MKTFKMKQTITSQLPPYFSQVVKSKNIPTNHIKPRCSVSLISILKGRYILVACKLEQNKLLFTCHTAMAANRNLNTLSQSCPEQGNPKILIEPT